MRGLVAFRVSLGLVAIGLTAVLVFGATAPKASGPTITLTNQTWTCNQALSNYGDLPIWVESNWTQTDTVEFGVRLGANCAGDGNPATLDLILHIKGDGINGPYGDAIRVLNASPGAHDIEIEGFADCGRARAGNHQDGIQAIGGTNITWQDFHVGANAPSGMPSCQGAGGAMFYSHAGSVHPENMVVENGSYYGCNTALREGSEGQSGAVLGSHFYNGYDPDHPTACRDSEGEPFAVPQTTCHMDNPLVYDEANTCDRWPWG